MLLKFIKLSSLFFFSFLTLNAGAQKKYVIKQNFPIGKKYDITLVSDQVINQQIGGQKINMTQTIGTDYTFDIRNGDQSEKNIEVVYKRIFMKSLGMGNTMAMDSDDPDTTKLNSFRGLKGARFNMVMLPDGGIQSLTGIGEMVDNMVKKMNLDSAKSSQMKAMLKQQFSAEGMKHTMESSLKIYPEQPVKVGDTWTVDTKIQLTMPVETITKYTLKDVKGNTAYLNINGTLVSKGEFSSMGNKIQTNLTGTNAGDAELDLKTGLITKSHSRIELVGKLETMGTNIDFELQGINKITAQETPQEGIK
ncbi:DUF6263 family protein [Pedobacter sandarakinus]|uniref:DUF6263 family protein n=1 Tax=Pedobacter sandarakinus TaxID=353156 RepID=UPI0022454206|nr:DUF6263 family protein [Pedobacter sandarakinus]MCX2573484.1 DUF6263 family protein [Pedobacter sandarakinus]